MLLLLAEIIWTEDTVAIVLGCSILIIGILAGAWAVIETTKSDNALKSEMVRQGMSAEDIERVLSAKRSKKQQAQSGRRVRAHPHSE